MGELERSLAQLKELKKALEDQLMRVNSAIEDVEKAQRSLGPMAGSFLTTLSLKSEPREPLRVRGALSPAAIARATRDVLLERGHPMKRGELVKELVRREVPLAGKDKNKNLGTILWRHPNMFVTINKLGYWVKGVPLIGVYEPPEEHSDELPRP